MTDLYKKQLTARGSSTLTTARGSNHFLSSRSNTSSTNNFPTLLSTTTHSDRVNKKIQSKKNRRHRRRPSGFQLPSSTSSSSSNTKSLPTLPSPTAASSPSSRHSNSSNNNTTMSASVCFACMCKLPQDFFLHRHRAATGIGQMCWLRRRGRWRRNRAAFDHVVCCCCISGAST